MLWTYFSLVGLTAPTTFATQTGDGALNKKEIFDWNIVTRDVTKGWLLVAVPQQDAGTGVIKSH